MRRPCIVNTVLALGIIVIASCATDTMDLNTDIVPIDKESNIITLPNIEESENITPIGKNALYMSTRTQAICKGYSFTLIDGLIWEKKDSESSYHLFLDTGLPHSNSGSFIPPHSIRQIAADADSLFAFSDEGRLYHIFLYKATVEKPLVWYDTFGFPKGGRLILNDLVEGMRGWSIGVRRKPVLWYEDIFGNEHHYGTMGLETLYVLCQDGRNIRFTDSGLPPDFSRSIQGPEDGQFIAKDISVSASTIFLISDNGHMYTRLIDFDTMGCDTIFFKYTYAYKPAKYDGTQFRSNYESWGLPAEPWREQPPPILEGKARLTHHISILQTGHGNQARVLRVAGLDKDGRTGYYTRRIFAGRWQFVAAPLILEEGDFLTSTSEPIASEVTQDNTSYTGVVLDHDKVVQGIECRIPSLSLDSECKTTLTIKDTTSKDSFSIDLYLVEMWTHLRRYDPGHDGTNRNYYISVVNPNNMDSSDNGREDIADIRALQSVFARRNMELYSMRAVACDNYIRISIPKSWLKYMGFREDDISLYLVRDSAFTGDINNVPLQQVLLSGKRMDTSIPEMILETGEDLNKPYTKDDLPLIEERIKYNELYIEELRYRLKKAHRIKSSNKRTKRLYSTLNIVFTLTLIKQINAPKIKWVFQSMGELLDTNAITFSQSLETWQWLYPRVMQLVNDRIFYYKDLAQRIKTVGGEQYLEPRLRHSWGDYIDSLLLPGDLTGHSPIMGGTAAIESISDSMEFPCYTFTARSSSGEDMCFLLELLGVNKIALARGGTEETLNTLSARPLRLPIVLYTIGVDKDLKREHHISRGQTIKGTLIWNGKQLSIELKHKIQGQRVIFQGVVP